MLFSNTFKTLLKYYHPFQKESIFERCSHFFTIAMSRAHSLNRTGQLLQVDFNKQNYCDYLTEDFTFFSLEFRRCTENVKLGF